MLKYDFHLHTTFSPDATASAQQMAEAAAHAGLSCIAFTDHCDLGARFNTPEWKIFDARAISAEVSRLKACEEIEILHGIELGQACEQPDVADRLLAENDYDIVLGSLHALKNGFSFSRGKFGQSEYRATILRPYLDELYDIAAAERFDSLAHFSYPLRYINPEARPMSMLDYPEQVHEIFRLLIRAGKAYEVNTCHLSVESFGEELTLLKLYLSLGGELITLGSDAHSTAAIACNYGLAERLLSEAGVSSIAVYKKRRPELRPLLEYRR